MSQTVANCQRLARHARAAAKSRDWAAARAAWTVCLSAAEQSPPEDWSLGLLRATVAQGDIAAARAQTAAIVARNPASLAARAALLGLLLSRHDHAGLAEEAGAGSLADAPFAEGLLPHFRAISILGHLPASRAAFDRLLPMLSAPMHLQILFDRAPECFGPVALRQRWDAIALRLAAPGGHADTERDALVRRTLALRLDIARGNHAAFLERWATDGDVLPAWQPRFAALAGRLSNPDFPDRTRAKVFGIGLSKTGTTSLAEALRVLGYDPAHFRNPFTNAIIGDADFDLFDALNDEPVAARFETLHALYPNAVFILTERAFAGWRDSVLRHRLRAHGTTARRDVEALAAADGPDSPLEARLPVHALYRSQDLATVHSQFNARVTSFFAGHPSARLLRLNVFEGQGWLELCAFLGHDVPPQPFPHVNSGTS